MRFWDKKFLETENVLQKNTNYASSRYIDCKQWGSSGSVIMC